jgi:hypothetical protein
MASSIFVYLAIGLLFTLWMNTCGQFGWVPGTTGLRKLLSVFVTTTLWWLVIIMIAID